MAASSSIEECVAETGKGRISYLAAGEGPALVLLHGVGSAARSWRAQLQAFASSHRVIAWNAPGYDVSTPLQADAPVTQDYAEALCGFLDALRIQRCDIVGHSLGALMAARFACAFPDHVRSLTLASCAIGHARLDPAERQRLLDSRIGDVDALGARGMAEKRGPRLVTASASDEMRRSVVETMALIQPHGYAQAARMLSTGDMIADIGNLAATLPVQFVYGTADVITTPEVNLRAAAARPAAAVHAIEGAGHAVYIEQPAAFNQIVASFIGAGDDQRQA